MSCLKVRRLVTDYDKLKQKERQNIVIKIEQYLRGRPRVNLWYTTTNGQERQLKIDTTQRNCPILAKEILSTIPAQSQAEIFEVYKANEKL